MGLTVKNLSQVMFNFARSEDKVTKGSLAALKKAAEVVRQKAVQYAPVDTGDLEKAIVAVSKRDRTSLGRFGATVYEIGVDQDKLNLEDHAWFDYSIPMHEGVYTLGPKSEAKQAATGMSVGPKYVERAFVDTRSEVMRIMEEAVKRSAR